MQLHHQAYGERGAPLLILHGLFGSLENWATISRRLSAEFTVFALDLRNHGRSPHAPEMSLVDMAGDVREFMAAHHFARAHLLGHSMGGKVAMQLALDAPEQADRLVVVDIAPRAYEPRHGDILEALLALDLRRYRSRREVEEALEPRISDLAVRRFLLKNIAHEPGHYLRWRMDLQSIARNYSRLLDAVPRDRVFPGPALFIKGANSDYVLPGDEDDIRRLFPAAYIKAVPGAGHWVHAETPDAFTREALDFLR